MVPGIKLDGTIEEWDRLDFHLGDAVLLNEWSVGDHHLIGFTREIQNNLQQKLQTGTTPSGDFWQHFNNAVAQVAEAQVEAGNEAPPFGSGAEVDAAKAIRAREQASLAFGATMHIRNKLLRAYNDIVSLPDCSGMID